MSVFRLSLLVALATGCPSSDDEQWERFNADDVIEVAITPGAEPGEAVTADLNSTTGSNVVGSVTVDPGSGPAGTEHQVWVQVGDAYKEVVGRVLVEVDSADRGVESFTFEQDTADHGTWWLALESVGAADEARTDVFHVQLFTPVDQDVEIEDSGAAR